MLPFVPRGDKCMGPGVSWSLLTRGKLAVSPKAALSHLSTPLGVQGGDSNWASVVEQVANHISLKQGLSHILTSLSHFSTLVSASSLMR